MRLKRGRDSAYGQTIKDIARKEASMSHIGKGTGILWRGEYALQRHTPARERIDNKEDGGNIYELENAKARGYRLTKIKDKDFFLRDK